ncbi:hypothetical protein ABZ829_27675 [Streptomyces xanthochromogenes]|uniref:hypothetical protein n=1 Tax=Streptomyces xanthochromogenes TaxID=67384 RepID=UPI00344AB044
MLEYLDADGNRATINLPPTGQPSATVFNLTPHPIRLYASVREDGIDDLEPHLRNVIPPQPAPARLTIRERQPLNGIEQVEYGHAVGLPPARDGHRYIVSLVVAFALTGQRTDLLVPYSEVRNATGTVIGCRALAQPALPNHQPPPTPEPPTATPNGCRFCGIAQRVHGRQYTPEQGWHAWTAPTDQQRLDRMRARHEHKTAPEHTDALCPWVSLISDLDRCEHGRHEGDPCGDSCGTTSKGNPHMQPGTVIGYSLRRGPIVMPHRDDKYVPAAWRSTNDRHRGAKQ